MSIYRFSMPWGDSLVIEANLAEASAPIRVQDDGGWRATPYQTASAGHCEWSMLRLVLDWLGGPYYAEDSMDDDDTLEEVIAGATLNDDDEEETL